MEWSPNRLSATDAELLAWARRVKCPLLTNDGDLIRACNKLDVEAVDTVQTLSIPREKGIIDQKALARVVFDITYHEQQNGSPRPSSRPSNLP